MALGQPQLPTASIQAEPDAVSRTPGLRPGKTDDTSGFDAAHATASWGSVQPSSAASGCSASTLASFSSVMSPAVCGCT